jgi:hypothetical protein
MKHLIFLCLNLLLLGLLPRTGQCAGLETFGYACMDQLSPENNTVPFSYGSLWDGRVHINGNAVMSTGGAAVFTGRFSTTEESVWNLSFPQYNEVFPAGLCLEHSPIAFDYEDELLAIRAACLPAHRWAASVDSLPLTTLIRFDGPVYHAAQFSQTQAHETDTLYTVPWTTLPLPGPAEPQLIWVQGVARVKGVVEGQVTLLASDSLFIMGDLLVADTILEPCPWSTPPENTAFGTVPLGSPNRIGLIGERDVIVAATLENGFSNGAFGGPDCGMTNDPVVSVCNQTRRDVIVTAAVLALGCSFESEFWKTTAWGCNVPTVSTQPEPCGGDNNSHIQLWDNVPGGTWPDCPGANNLSDRRGTLWLCGSLAAARGGYVVRYPVGPWGQARIGYDYRKMRHDGNLDISPPPYWPDAIWVALDTLVVTPRIGEASACGEVDPPTFLQDWNSGAVSLVIEAPGYQHQWGDVSNGQVVIWLNGQLVASTPYSADSENPFHWAPAYDLQPGLEQAGELWLEVRQGDSWGESGEFDASYRWNVDGSVCAWTWQATAVDPAAPAGFQLSEPWPNPFNPSCRVELSLPAPGRVTLEVFDLLGRREALLHDGALAAGRHEFTLDGASWAAGLHILHVQHASGAETRKLLVLK